MLLLPVLIATAAAGFFWAVYQYVKHLRRHQGLQFLPGPKGYPLIGNLLNVPRTFVYRRFLEWTKIYGPIYQIDIAGTTHVVISDAEISNDLLALRGSHYSNRHRSVMLMELVSKNGNLGGAQADTKYWKNARKFAASTLSTSSLELWSPLQVQQAARMVRDFVIEPDIYEHLFERYSASVALRLLYDRKLSEDEEGSHLNTILTIVRTLEETAAPSAYIVDFLPALKHLPTWLATFKAEAQQLHDFEFNYFRNLVRDGEKKFLTQKKRERSTGPRSLLQAYCEDKESWDLTDFEIIYAMGTLLEGGSGTTSSTMQSFCLAMWHYPEWQRKIQVEIDQFIGPHRLPSFEDWPNLPTVRAAMKETLRWRPVVPGGIPHRATKDDKYNGYFIPKGAVVHALQYAMFKDESLYPNAEEFNPGRWLDPKYPTYQEPLTQYPNLKRFPAFGFGRRICPGVGLAERSLFIEISTLLWACCVERKLDARGEIIPVPWREEKPGQNTGPYRFDFTLRVRDEDKMHLLSEAAAAEP